METRKIEVPNDILISEIKRAIEQGKTATFRVKGYSMRPFLDNNRDIVKIEHITPEAISVRDVVLAEIEPKQYVLHRVISRTDNQLTLKGDGNVKGVEHCIDTQVIGLFVCMACAYSYASYTIGHLSPTYSKEPINRSL